MNAKTKSNNTTGFSEKTSDIILVIICAVALFIVAYPLYYILIASVSNPYDVYAGKTFSFQVNLHWMDIRRYLRIPVL